MCLIAFAWGASERYSFVIAANRDEFLARPTATLSQWISPGGATLVGGRDLKDGGTWMGFSPNGRFAMLTNVRDPQAAPPEQPISRGGLALAWLESDLLTETWLKSLEPQRYQGFNLIVGNWQNKQCHYLTNSTKNSISSPNSKPFEQIAVIESARGAIDLIAYDLPWGEVYGLSNAALDTPWPKTRLLKSALHGSLAHTDVAQLIEQNLRALAHRAKPADEDLPKTGVPLELERALSSAFVSHPENAPQYGTRTSLVAVHERGLGLKIHEVTHTQDGCTAQQVSAKLAWP